MKIEITCGTYGARGKFGICPVSAGEMCEVDSGEASRLVTLGVARIVEDLGESEAETASGEFFDEAEGNFTPEEENAEEGEADAISDIDDLKELSVADLRHLAGDMGLDTLKLKTKTAIINAICAFEAEHGGASDPGVVLDAEPPIE